MTRHTLHRLARSFAPLLLIALGWIAVTLIGDYDDRHRHAHSLGSELIAVAGIPALLAVAVGAFLSARASRRSSQRSRTTSFAADVAAARGWAAARALARYLVLRRPLPALTVWGLVLAPDETAHLDLSTNYARLHLPYGWQEFQSARLIVTDQRMLCDVAGQWLSFWHADVVGFYPEPEHWSVVLDYAGTVPLRLTGPTAPAIAVYATYQLYGRPGLLAHPGLKPLRTAA